MICSVQMCLRTWTKCSACPMSKCTCPTYYIGFNSAADAVWRTPCGGSSAARQNHTYSGVFAGLIGAKPRSSTRTVHVREADFTGVKISTRDISLEIEMAITYEITPDLAGWSARRKALRFLLWAGGFAALQVVSDLLFPSLSSGERWLDFAEAVVSGLIFAALMLVLAKRSFDYKIVVSDDSITAVHPWFQYSVQRNRVRTIIETRGSILSEPALRISKYGRIGMWFLGGIWIPRTVPQYDSIRSLALQWRTPR